MTGSRGRPDDRRSDQPADPTGSRPDVLFVMQRLVFLRFFQSTLDLMIERGLNVRLLLESPRSDPVEQAWLDRARTRPNFSVETIDHFKRAPFAKQQAALRLGMEYVRRLGPAYENRVAGRPRARLSRAPKSIQALTRLPALRTPAGLRALYGVLAAIDRAVPVPEAVTTYLEQANPRVLAICDKGHPGSLSSGYVAAARRLGIPTALCVASWDNLTNRQRIPVTPDELFVWNDRQRQEAVEFHGIPAERVVLTGAPRFDEWFSWQPRERDVFLTRVGLDPAKPVVLWIGGALNPAEITEAAFVARWIAAVRASDDPRLRDAGILVRPHPERLPDWSAADYSSFGNVTVWPREGMTFPIDHDGKADFYDSIFHADAVVGINTSAMIEASIVGRPVLTAIVPEFDDSQLATFHFSYLLDSEGGPVRVSRSPEALIADLGATLAADDAEAAARARDFIKDFVRPFGLEQSATELFVDRLEELARSPRHSEGAASGLSLASPILAAVRGARSAREAARRLRRAAGRGRTAYRRLAKRRTKARKSLRKSWRQHGQPHLSRALKQPDRLRLQRTGAAKPLAAFRRAQPDVAFRPDYSDLLFLYRLIRERRPETVLEFGSGCSTAVIAAALRDNGRGHLWSVESDEAWSSVTASALPAGLQAFATVVHSPAVEDDRDVQGWSYAHVPDVVPDVVYLDGPPHTRDRKVAFDVLDLESRLRPGFTLVVDGRGRNAHYLRDHLTRDYDFVEHHMRWRQMYRYTFELLDPDQGGTRAADDLSAAPVAP